MLHSSEQLVLSSEQEAKAVALRPILNQKGVVDAFPVLQPGDHVAVRIAEQKGKKSCVDEGDLAFDQWMLVAPAQGDRVMPLQEGQLEVLKGWPQFLQSVRSYFEKQGLFELWTPNLVPCPGLEPSLEPFVTHLKTQKRERKLFLPTSPEIHLKKALCLGWTDIFEIKVCYRNNEFGPHHQLDFHMLEWYRAHSSLESIRADLIGLIEHLRLHGFTKSRFKAPLVTTFKELFERIGLELTPEPSLVQWRDWCEKLHLNFSEDDQPQDLFHRLWLEKIEPALQQPTIVWGFPRFQAALARFDESGFVDRFEFFWRGLEIANAFHEVNDPIEQKERWQMEIAERKRLGTAPLSEDEQLLEMMKSQGLPPSGGIALGLERLYLACQGLQDLKLLRLFPAPHDEWN